MGVIVLTALGTRRIHTVFPILPLLCSSGHLNAAMITARSKAPMTRLQKGKPALGGATQGLPQRADGVPGLAPGSINGINLGASTLSSCTGRALVKS